MGRKSKDDILQDRLIAKLEADAFDPAIPRYVQLRAAATLSGLMVRRDKRRAERAGTAATRRAEREDATPKPWMNILPVRQRDLDALAEGSRQAGEARTYGPWR